MDARMPPTERWPFNWVCNTRHNKLVCSMQRTSKDLRPHFGVCSALHTCCLAQQTHAALRDQYSAGPCAAHSPAAPRQQTTQQSLCSHSPQQPLGSSQVNSL